MTLRGLLGVTCGLAVVNAALVTPTCKKTNSSLTFQGLPGEEAFYCSKTYSISDVARKIEAGDLPEYFYQRQPGRFVDYQRDSPDIASYMAMECLPHQNVVPVSAWFEYLNGVFEEDLARVLGVKGDKEVDSYDSCSGSQVSCIRSWAEIFPLRKDPVPENRTLLKSLIQDMSRVEALHLEYLCVSSYTKDQYHPLVTYSDASYSAEFDVLDTSQDGSLIAPLSAKASNAAAPRFLKFQTAKICPAGSSSVEPLLVIDGANCSPGASVDLTGAARLACDPTNPKLYDENGNFMCQVALPPQIADGATAPRVPGCLRRRAIGIGRCVVDDKHVRTVYQRLREFAALKTVSKGARMTAFNPLEALQLMTCTFANPYGLGDAITKEDMCCMMQTLRFANSCTRRKDWMEFAAAPVDKTTAKDSATLTVGATLTQWADKMRSQLPYVSLNCAPTKAFDTPETLEAWKDSYTQRGVAGKFDVDAYRTLQRFTFGLNVHPTEVKNVIDDQKKQVEIENTLAKLKAAELAAQKGEMLEEKTADSVQAEKDALLEEVEDIDVDAVVEDFAANVTAPELKVVNPTTSTAFAVTTAPAVITTTSTTTKTPLEIATANAARAASPMPSASDVVLTKSGADRLEVPVVPVNATHASNVAASNLKLAAINQMTVANGGKNSTQAAFVQLAANVNAHVQIRSRGAATPAPGMASLNSLADPADLLAEEDEAEEEETGIHQLLSVNDRMWHWSLPLNFDLEFCEHAVVPANMQGFQEANNDGNAEELPEEDLEEDEFEDENDEL